MAGHTSWDQERSYNLKKKKRLTYSAFKFSPPSTDRVAILVEIYADSLKEPSWNWLGTPSVKKDRDVIEIQVSSR